jgi:hypothetical protein
MTLTSRPILAVTLFTVYAASPASAQGGKRVLGDTLRFVSTSKMGQEMNGSPMGPMSMSVDMYARTTIVFGAGDTIRMWTDSMTYDMKSPAGNQSPDASKLINKVAVAVFNPDGSVRVVSPPDKMIEDLAASFSGAMPDEAATFPVERRLPATPLRAGVAWADTSVRKPDANAPNRMGGTTIVKNRVVGDSLIHGLPVFIIESTADIEATTEMNPGPEMSMKGTTKMTTSMRKYYSPAYRIYVMQSGKATGTSTQTIEGPVSMTLSGPMTTESVMKLLPR